MNFIRQGRVLVFASLGTLALAGCSGSTNNAGGDTSTDTSTDTSNANNTGGAASGSSSGASGGGATVGGDTSTDTTANNNPPPNTGTGTGADTGPDTTTDTSTDTGTGAAPGGRRRVLLAFELAERQGDTGVPLQFVVVGGGPTGVELAGTLAEIARHAMTHEFRRIKPEQSRILLIEGGRRVLPAYSDELSRKAEEQLKRLGVEVRTSKMVTCIEAGSVWTGEERIPAAVVLWAAGVAASPLGRKLGASVDRAGRVQVAPDLSLPGHREVMVIGDLAALNDEHGKLLPGVAQVAIQEGNFAGDMIARDLHNQARSDFHYHDRGSLATIGRNAAVAQFPGFQLSGYFAWLAWLFIHILFLIGFRNRLVVMINWAWSYMTYERGARLITGSDHLDGWDQSQGTQSRPPAQSAPSATVADERGGEVSPPIRQRSA